MSNFRLTNPDCVLIHIPKTAGTSIRKGVWAGRVIGPPAFGTIPADWNDLFKFTFVRHPLDRFVSAWKMFAEGPRGDTQWKPAPDAYPVSLEKFFEIVTNEDIIYDERRRTFEERIRHHAIPQTHPFNCLKDADYVGRFENIDADFQEICARLNLKAELPKIHCTQHKHWSEELSPGVIQKCYKYYEDDFVQLNYAV